MSAQTYDLQTSLPVDSGTLISLPLVMSPPGRFSNGIRWLIDVTSAVVKRAPLIQLKPRTFERRLDLTLDPSQSAESPLQPVSLSPPPADTKNRSSLIIDPSTLHGPGDSGGDLM